ncbi:MAG: sulfatase-like hydrolase/transferase [Rhodospirillales bacterium]|jgi:choline-sulfatase|nr:sulfatase-like hydrolase/transferase [Rhodospirillales bacterium]
MKPKNLLFIFSDEHTRDISGCYGNTVVKTPNIDRLAANGTVFNNAYTTCPICVPARASLATGLYVHDIGCWDNAHPYVGEPEGWGHRLMAAGHHVTATGKLHMCTDKHPNGHSEEIETLHVIDGIGDLRGSIREPIEERATVKLLAETAGPGESTYTAYDARTAAHAIDWLTNEAPKHTDKPWVLYVGFTLPHFPLVCPQEFYDLYDPDEIPWPRLYGPDQRPTHPAVREVIKAMAYDKYFDAEKVRIALRAYYGMVSYLDHQIGRVLSALEDNDLGNDTRILYSSDHGDNMGNRGMWGKSIMYEESAAVPWIMSGPDIPVGHTVDTLVTLVDFYQTALDCCGLPLTDTEENILPGHSLFRIIDGELPDRIAFSEYHAAGSPTGMYMIRDGRWKYVYYVGYPPQLFDLEADPHEAVDLGESAEHADVLAACEAKLRAIVDPEAANAQAFADQHAKVASFGGPEAVKSRGDFSHTPAPGEKVVFG